MRRVMALVASVCALAAMSACGDPHDSSDADGRLKVILRSTEAAETARVQLEMSGTNVDDGGSDPPQTATGVVDFEHREGMLSAPHTADESGTDMRWIRGTVYQHDTVGLASLRSQGGKSWTSIDYERIGAAAGCQPHTFTATAVLGVPGAGEGVPSAVLEQLRASGAALDRVGTEVVRGVTTTRWKVRSAAGEQRVKCIGALNSALKTNSLGYEIWTDAENRLRRARTALSMTLELGGDDSDSHANATKDTFTVVLTTELFDFGTEVHVEAPPSNEVVDTTDALITYVRGVGRVSGSDWHQAAHGTFHGKSWTIWYADSTNGWRCDDVDGPDDDGGPPDIPIANSVRHNGRFVACVPPELMPMFFESQFAGVDGDEYVVVGLATGGARPILEFADGTSTPLTVDARTDVVEWRGPTAPKPVRVRFGKESCALDENATNAEIC